MNLGPYSVFTKDQPLYPALLKEFPLHPEKLYVAGEASALDGYSIAVVGSRRMTSYGEAAVNSIVGELVYSGITIVSGLAFGVDIASQSLALKLGGRTVSVLGSGLNKIVPVTNASIAKQIVSSGCGAVISAYPPDMEASKYNFIERDKVMAAISKAVLVVEAAEKSGTAHTVKAALDLGREVFVVPGSIFSDYSRGCHRYIQDGAHLVTCAQDIFDILGTDITQNYIKGSVKGDFGDAFNKEYLEVFEHIDTYGISVDDLCAKTNKPAAFVLVALTSLELAGVVKIEGNLVKAGRDKPAWL